MIAAITLRPIVDFVHIPPLSWVTEKLRAWAKAFFGYIVRILIFQMGEMNAPGARQIMRIYQRLMSDPREEKPFDPKRLADSKALLKQIGGVEDYLFPADGQAIVHCMSFKSADFFAKLREAGSNPVPILHEGRRRTALLNPPPFTEKFYFPLIQVRMADGTRVRAALLPESPEGNQPRPLILHSHSPGRSMCMDRKFIGLHLAAGYDVIVWDPRGTAESEVIVWDPQDLRGRPSQGGYNNDGEAVFQHALRLGYPPNRIYVSGFCEGASVAAHLKRLYHHLGVHFIGSNPYTSIKEVLKGHGWLGKLGAKFGLEALQDPSIPVAEPFLNFNNVGQFRGLPRSEGKFIFIHTDTDQMMPRGTVQKLIDAINRAGPSFEILRPHPDPNINGHMQPPYEDPRTWHRYVELVT